MGNVDTITVLLFMMMAVLAGMLFTMWFAMFVVYRAVHRVTKKAKMFFRGVNAISTAPIVVINPKKF